MNFQLYSRVVIGSFWLGFADISMQQQKIENLNYPSSQVVSVPVGVRFFERTEIKFPSAAITMFVVPMESVSSLYQSSSGADIEAIIASGG